MLGKRQILDAGPPGGGLRSRRFVLPVPLRDGSLPGPVRCPLTGGHALQGGLQVAVGSSQLLEYGTTRYAMQRARASVRW